jgi:ubiquinone/menaquinone biosynthesis C-methylase UbiE
MIRNPLRTIKQLTSKGGIEGYFAEKYDEFARAALMDEYREIAGSVIKHLKSGKILEIGPGPGYLSIEIAKRGNFRITGLDISETMIEIAKRNAQEAGVTVEFRVGDAADMPFHDNTFDFVISSGSLHHWEKPVKVFNEIYRVLKTDGKALIVDLRRDASKEEIDKITKKTASLIMRWGIKHSVEEAYTKDQVIVMLGKTKFKEGEIKENPVGLEIWLKK